MPHKRFPCKICSKSFTQKALLKKHSATHGKSKLLVTVPSSKKAKLKKDENTSDYICDVCNKTFVNKFKLLRHSYSHMRVKPFPCDICKRRFTRKDHLKVHYRNHTGEKSCFCEECGVGFNTTTSLNRHMLRLHSENRKTFICSVCDLEFVFKAQLKKHYDLSHKKCFACSHCGNLSTTNEGLQRHLKKHVISKPFVCLMCAASFDFIDDMRFHECFPMMEDPCKVIVRVTLEERIDDEDSDDQREALRLEKKFDHRGRKRKYPRNDVDETNDDEERSKKPNLNLLQESVLFGKGVTKTCKFCEKEFASMASKLAHEASHLSNHLRNYQCQICSNEYVTISKLARHLRLHTGELPFSCSFCDEKFHRRDYLTRHLHNHGLGDQACSVCYKMCSSAEDLHEHMKMHDESFDSETVTYVCNSCAVAFESQLELDEHLVNEHPVADYSCRFCDVVFSDISDKTDHEALCREASISQANMNGTDHKAMQKAHVSGDPRLDESDELYMSLENKKAKKFSARKYACVRPEKSVHHCKECDATYDSLHDFLVHVQEHSTLRDEGGIASCILCDETFDSVDRLNKHIMNHEDCAIVEVGIHDSDEFERDS